VLAADRVGLHADADEVVGLKELESLGFGERHGFFILQEAGDSKGGAGVHACH
jgi:hypothetical protein